MAFLLPALASALAGPAISKVGNLLGFEKGGTVPGKGKKGRMAVVHPGEVVLTKAKLKQLNAAKTPTSMKNVLKAAAKVRPARIVAKPPSFGQISYKYIPKGGKHVGRGPATLEGVSNGQLMVKPARRRRKA
tara:strand:- start:1834 stop:2229 length:396 start_codon:yes stop_codon:yes gene_type:complete